MGSLMFGAFLAVIGLVGYFLTVPNAVKSVKNVVATVLIGGGVLFAGFGAVGYNDAGKCQHIRDVMGNESSTCDTGWYFLGWGTSTEWNHFITVANTDEADAEGSAVSTPYTVRLADNWSGEVTQATRFAIPQDNEQFITMARTFRSPERLITTTLRPAVRESLDSTANLFSMEEYYAGGQRDAFKTEYRDAVTKGRAQVRQSFTSRREIEAGGQAANDDVSDESNLGTQNVTRSIMVKVLDSSGNAIREEHAYMQYGIVVASAILENLDPDDLFEEQIQARKEAAARRVIAVEERREQEEQRLLAIQAGETNIAKRQAEARVEQIERTTDAETEKQLVIIAANQQKEQAEIDRDTAAIRLEQARIDAETQQTLADAEAYEREVILAADNALQAKLDAWVAIQQSWAAAAADINVPSTVFTMGGDGEGGTTGNFASVEAFMALLTANAAQSLDLDPSIADEEQK